MAAERILDGICTSNDMYFTLLEPFAVHVEKQGTENVSKLIQLFKN